MRGEAQVTVDRAALRHNIAVLRAAVAPAQLMAVVKANGYGHGAITCALAFEEAGVDWLGVVDLDEGVALRRAGLVAPILCWLHAPGETFERAVEFGITPGVSDLPQLEACARAGVPAVHLCLDTGLSRNGAVESEWPALFDAASALRGVVEIEGVMSHLSNTSPDDDDRQSRALDRAIGLLAERGIDAPIQHLSASASALSGARPRNLVRFGLACYGLSPFATRTSAELRLRPALTLTAPVAGLKRVPAGEGVSYGYSWKAPVDTRIALLPIGYADGIDRLAGNRAQVFLGGRLRPVVGRIAMNALTVDLGDGPDAAAVSLGDDAVLFGDPAHGHPSVEAWADATETINYEVVTRLSPALPRRYLR